MNIRCTFIDTETCIQSERERERGHDITFSSYDLQGISLYTQLSNPVDISELDAWCVNTTHSVYCLTIHIGSADTYIVA